MSTRFDANIHIHSYAFLATYARRLRILRARRAADALNLRALVLDQTREVQRARAGRAFARAPDASRELDVDDDGIDDDEWISTTRAGFDDDARVSSRR